MDKDFDKKFIEEYWLDVHTSQCLLDFAQQLKDQGLMYLGKSGINGNVNSIIKDSLEVSLSEIPPQVMEGDDFTSYGLNAYKDHLMQKATEYSHKYLGDLPICTVGPPKIQWYDPGQAYYAEHFDNGMEHDHRMIAFITYLQDIEEGGGTQFVHQNYTVKSEKGKTVFFPAGYTHLHKGVPAPNDTKVIFTGWFQWFTALDETVQRRVK